MRLHRLEAERKRYSTDFKAFAIELGIVPDAQPQPHDEVFEFISLPDKYKLVLLPRDSFKSTIVSVAYPLWRLCYNPNLRVLIDSRTIKRSQTFLREIKTHIGRNEQFQELYGDWKAIPGWGDEQIILPHRTMFVGTKQPSIICGGIDSPVTGGHYDIIICDDLIDETNSQSEAGCNKAILHYKTLFPILEPEGEMFVVGTIWSHMDVYNHIMDNEPCNFYRSPDLASPS